MLKVNNNHQIPKTSFERGGLNGTKTKRGQV